ncbi:MAG TPA: hypothetical protein VGW39_16770 [Chthoniobacterales bacterium]|nr:hypothetical protein [Chthoniobacterales bacterium]
MKKTSGRESAFFTPRISGACRFGAIAVALTLLAFFALPTHSAQASRGYCSDVEIYYEYGGPTGIQIEMESYTLTDPSYECMVFFTTDGSNPTHSGPTPTGNTSVYYGPLSVPYLQCKLVKALGWLLYYSNSQNITSDYICNPPQ